MQVWRWRAGVLQMSTRAGLALACWRAGVLTRAGLVLACWRADVGTAQGRQHGLGWHVRVHVAAPAQRVGADQGLKTKRKTKRKTKTKRQEGKKSRPTFS